MRDLPKDGGAISVRGCRLEPSHRDAGSPTGSSAHTFVVAQENHRRAPASSSPADDMTGVHSRTLTQACYGLPLGSRWLGSTMLCILAATVAVGHAYRAIRNASYLGSQCPRTGRPRVLEHQSPTTQLSMRLQPGAHRARYGCRRHAWAVCSVAGASFAHSTHQIFRTLKCARDMSPLDQGEIELARARRDATALVHSRGLGRASTSPPRAAVAVAVIGRAVVATHVRRTAATTSRKAVN